MHFPVLFALLIDDSHAVIFFYLVFCSFVRIGQFLPHIFAEGKSFDGINDWSFSFYVLCFV